MMSERLLAGDGTFSVLLAVNDQIPLLCTAVHIVNNSTDPVTFEVDFGPDAIAPYTNLDFTWTAKAGIDQTFPLPTPLPIVETANFKGTTGWAVQGLVAFGVTQAPAAAAKQAG
jgi:hypothetical protein